MTIRILSCLASAMGFVVLLAGCQRSGDQSGRPTLEASSRGVAVHKKIDLFSDLYGDQGGEDVLPATVQAAPLRARKGDTFFKQAGHRGRLLGWRVGQGTVPGPLDSGL